jgi:AbiV family abortive infection protein
MKNLKNNNQKGSNTKRLSYKNLSLLINACFCNAERLYSDGHLLFEDKRIPSAYSLLAICKQELGKIKILNSLAAVKREDDDRYKEIIKCFRDHNAKNLYTLGYQIPYNKTLNNEASKIFAHTISKLDLNNKRSPFPKDEEISRLNSLYVDLGQNSKSILLPEDVITYNETFDLLCDCKLMLETARKHKEIGFFSEEYLTFYNAEMSWDYNDLNLLLNLPEEQLNNSNKEKIKNFLKKASQKGIIRFHEEDEIMGMNYKDFLE